jgi:hypothetical protein
MKMFLAQLSMMEAIDESNRLLEWVEQDITMERLIRRRDGQ